MSIESGRASRFRSPICVRRRSPRAAELAMVALDVNSPETQVLQGVADA